MAMSNYDYKTFKFPDTIKNEILQTNTKLDWSLSPNPSVDGRVKIVFPDLQKGEIDIQLFSLEGKMVCHKRMTNLSKIEELNLNTLSRGTYIFRINSEGQSDEKKWIYR